MKMNSPIDLWQSLTDQQRIKLIPILTTNWAFKKVYRNDPVAFIHDCIEWKDERPAKYQDEICAQVPHERVCARGPHGPGKTAMAAWLVHWFALTRDGEDWKCITTASVWRQLDKYLWPEIHKWARRIRWDKIGRDSYSERDELLTLHLKLKTGAAFAIASDDPSLIEGAHADHIFYLFDEAKSIPPGIWDAAEGAFSTAGSDTGKEALAFAISTPGDPVSRFYDIQTRKPGFEDWWTKHITLEEAIQAGRISKEWAGQREKQWGKESSVYQNRVEGNFASAEEDSLISLAWVEQANRIWEEWKEKKERSKPDRVGADIARFGEDTTEFALKQENIITEIRTHRKRDTMETSGFLGGILKANPNCQAIVDVIGIGAGVVDRLREQDFEVISFNAGGRTDYRDRSGELAFADSRSAAWWNLREKLEAGEIGLPVDDELTGDLVAPKWKMTSSGKIKVESKDEIRKRIGRSTNKGDSVIQAFWEEGEGVDITIIR
jgi:hypothetical protein